MIRLWAALRSLIGMSAAIFLLGVIGPISYYLFILPRLLLQPAREYAIGAIWVRFLSRSLVRLMQVGGARFKIEGDIDTNKASVIIMNHQSVLDIPPLIHILKEGLPRFVIREKYTRGVPTVSRSTRFIGCIPVDPKKDRAAAVLALRKVAREGLNDRAVLVYPEGHRSRHGEVLPFRPAGLVALLSEKPQPVWVVVNDGLFRLTTIWDTFFALGTVRCRMKAIGPVMSPENADDLPAFIEGRRQVLIDELARMRAEALN
jgi:1-acyl-sn-glycerol-3-phosphate acyltransferase